MLHTEILMFHCWHSHEDEIGEHAWGEKVGGMGNIYKRFLLENLKEEITREI
jgi:hypothetical protein